MGSTTARLRTRRGLLGAMGTAVGGAVAGCLGGGGPDLPETTPTGPVASAPVPDSLDDHTYAAMGQDEAPVEVVYLGSWKCPFCADFSTGLLGDIVTDYVEPGDLRLRYRSLAYIDGEPFLGPDAPRAARAGLAVWNVDPSRYWRFHEYVMVNQPSEGKQWASAGTLTTMAERAGVGNPDAVRSAIENGDYQSTVERTSQRAASLGLRATPALVVGDSATNPVADAERTRTLLDKAVASAAGSDGTATGTESG